MKKYLLWITSAIFHLAAIGLIVYLAWPIAKWYLDQVPARGIDLWLSASYVSHLWKYFAFRFNGWKEFWYSGMPYAKDYPSFYFYLMLPLAKFFGLIPGIQRFAMIGLLIFAAFSYFLYHQLSQNRILAVVLSLATVFSANLYRALVWAGGIPFWTTQAFFPMVILLVAKFCQSQNYKWLGLAALATGLGVMGHPENFLNVIFPSAVLLLLFWQPGEDKFSFKKRLLDVIKLGGIVYLISLPVITHWLPMATVWRFFRVIFSSFNNQEIPSATGGTAALSETARDIEAWTKAQFDLVWLDSNQLLWYLLAVSLVLFIFSLLLRKKRLKAIAALIPFGLIAISMVVRVYLYSRGINLFYITGWYKAFWPLLVGTAMLTAFCWGEAKQVLAEREFWQKKIIRVIRAIGGIGVSLVLAGVGYYFLLPTQKTTIEKLERIDNFSSAFPEVLNAKTSQRDLLVLKEQLKPKLMVDDPRDYRLYVIDATFNIWWGALEEMPLTRGYVDPPLGFAERWGLFWLDSALGPTDTGPKSSLIEDWETPEAVADNNLRFLLDWYATKYLEGNHVSASNSNFASNIISDELIEAEEKVETRGGVAFRYTPKEYWSDEQRQFLQFYRVRSDLVSPILMASNATPVLHIGGEDGYDTLTRYLGMVNLGPRKIILARGPKNIDDLSWSDLKNFEAVILYKYDYRRYDQAWGLLGKYVEKGGKVFVDTGAEVKESDTAKLPKSFPSELPGLFPLKRTVREDLGRVWQPQAAGVPLTKGVDFSQFSPLDFDGQPWNISHPISDEDLREGAEVILRHRGIPVVMESEFGAGKVIWSGFNLPYHVIRDYNSEEGKFFQNLLAELVSLEEEPVLSKGSFISPRERVIEVDEARGVVFKEQAFEGWQAKIKFKGLKVQGFKDKRLKIYKVGPTSPGFMYVKLPKEFSGQVKFKYAGPLKVKLYSAISALTILFIIDYLLGGKVLMALARCVHRPIKKRIGGWWEKEEY